MCEKRILVVDDDANLRKTLSDILLGNGYTPVPAATGEEALDRIEEVPPAIAVIDLRLEDMSGLELLQKIKARRPSTECIVLTGHASQESAIEAVNRGAFSYLQKPYEMEQLLVTIRRAVEKREAEEQLRYQAHLLENVSDAIISTDMDFNVQSWNEPAERMYGWKADEVIGRPLGELVKPEYPNDSREYVIDTFLRSGHYEGEVIHHRKDGTPINILGSVSQLSDSAGNPVGAVSANRDITERKRMEAELHRAQKLESIGILAGGIAHDFNNLLTAVSGNISLAKMEAQAAGQEDVVDTLTHAERASLRARSLTKQLLTFAKGGAPVKVTASIAPLLRESAGFALRGSNVQCQFTIAEDLYPVDVDEGQISQVINNLVINAQQAMPQGGIVKVQAENRVVSTSRQDADSTKMPGLAAGRYVTVSVEDEGTGIPAEHLSQIFDPYFTTKQKGSGLGLATTHSIIKNHNGHTSVESTVGEGTTFRIYLPASSRELAASRVKELEIVKGQGKVLVMDDDEAVRDPAERLLRRAGYEVEQAEDGAEAIERYRQAHASGSPFDVVILDLTVPGGMGGVEAVSELREIDPQVKAIVSSGYSTDAVMADFQAHGFNGVIPKPYQPAQLSQIVHRVLTTDSGP